MLSILALATTYIQSRRMGTFLYSPTRGTAYSSLLLLTSLLQPLLHRATSRSLRPRADASETC